MTQILKTNLICLASAMLAACATGGETFPYPVQGTVLRVIDAHADTADLSSACMSAHADDIAHGKTYAAIRYRHWANRFVSTVFAEIPAGMAVHQGMQLEIVPASCARKQLAMIVRDGVHSTSE